MRHISYIWFLAGLAACGGGGKGPPDGPGPGPIGPQSPGGIWSGMDSMGQSAQFYIAENGDLIAQLSPDGGLIPSFGSGTADVSANNVINGSFGLRGALSLTPIQQAEDLGCSLSGTVTERLSLSVDVTCSDSGGIVYDEASSMFYDGNRYGRGSSLGDIAGNYTLPFQAATNSLNIAGDGTIFGMYHNGAQCTVNGTAAIIDANYTLIDVSWTMSACTGLIGNYEGVQMSGFAMTNPSPIGPPGSYYFLMTGQTQDGIYSISVIFEPV